MKELNKAAQFVENHFSGEKIIVSTWQSSTNFPGIWVLTKVKNSSSNPPSYFVYVCRKKFLKHQIITQIPILGPLYKDQVVTLSEGNEILWISGDALDSDKSQTETDLSKLSSRNLVDVSSPSSVKSVEANYDLEFLGGYTGQTTDELIALEGMYRTDSIVLAFEEALYQKLSTKREDGLSDAELKILAVEALEREVNNGGFDQFFFNSSKEFTPIIVQSLESIGCSKIAKLTQDAIGALGIEGAIEIEAIENIMENENDARDEILDACSDRYFDEAGDLSGHVFEFIKVNKRQIALM